MFKIVIKQVISKGVKRLDVMAPDIAQRAQPGQFAMVLPEENSSWIALSIVDTDLRRGTITFMFRESNEAAVKLGELPINGPIFSIVAPLGRPASIARHGTVVCVATDMSVVSLLPICRAFKDAGNRVIGVVGSKTKWERLVESQVRLSCSKYFLATEDGSYGRKGPVLPLLEEILRKEETGLVYAIGSPEVMQDIARLTAAKGIKLLVQLNTPMICGTGICGSCRVEVARKVVLACEHGPEFDGHKVDYDKLKARLNALSTAKQAGAQAAANTRSNGIAGMFSKLVRDAAGR